MEKKLPGCRRLVLIPFPLQGHINPMLQLGAILHSKGLPITVAHAQHNFPSSYNHPDFTFLPLADGLFGLDLISEGLKGFMSILNANCEAPLRELLVKMIQDKQGPDDQLPCIIYDGFMYFAEAVARWLEIASFTLRTSSAANFLTYCAFPGLRKDGYLPVQDSTLLDVVPWLHPLRFKDFPAYKVDWDLGSWLIGNLCDTRSSSAAIWNTTDCLERPSLADVQKFCQIPVFAIGPRHKISAGPSSSLLEEETSCISWLDKQTDKSVIYISLGSLSFMGGKELAEMSWGLANSKQPFLWVVRPGSIPGSQWIESLPDGFLEAVGETGCTVKWAPQKKVLAHPAMGGFWTHCGWNSILESLSEGVPMICRPSVGDQRVNARYVSHVWGVGLQLENDELERGEVESALRRLMVEQEGEEMRQKAMKLKEKIERSIKKDRSAYSSLNELVKFIISA